MLTIARRIGVTVRSHVRMAVIATFFFAYALFAGSSPLSASPSAKPKNIETPAAVASRDADEEPDAHPIVWPANVGSPEQLMYAQPQRMQHALEKLSPRTPGKTNLYLISFAGDGEEDVFRNEVEYVETLFVKRFAASGHVLTLINNPATLDRRPIASLSNLELAIDAMGKKLKVDQDILMIFITTHGSREHELYVSLDPLPLDQIVPGDLADIVADSPIKHRVFVISACYAGGFIDTLKNENTMVITAARSDRASFGCGTQADITDFGRAFFVDALNKTASFSDAFVEATHEIDTWETRDAQTHSLPQIASTPAIETALKAWRDGIKIGAPVPFKVPPVRKLESPESATPQTEASAQPSHELHR